MKKEYSPFGLFFSNLRKSRKQTISEAASLLNVSISYISSVEHGDREIPYEWIGKIKTLYDLNDEDAERLIKAYRETPSSKKVSLSVVEKCMTNFIDNFFDDKEKEEAMKDLKRRLDELKQNYK